MILVLLGTNPYSFVRLIEAVDLYAAKTKEKVVFQLGFSKHKPKHAEFFFFKPHDEIIILIKQADFLIVQGGYGSIYDCLLEKKKIIAVPRKRELVEALDAGLGQLELVQYLERNNRVIGLYEIEDLEIKIKAVKSFNPDFEFKNELSEFVSGILNKELNTPIKAVKSGYNIFKNIIPLIFKNRLTEMTYFVTDKCNFKCKHCFMLDQLNLKKTRFLSLEEVQEMGKHIHSMQRVHIGGGEPLIRNDIDEITVAIANEWNTQTICLPTNGSMQKNAVKTAELFGRKSDKYLRFHFSLNMIGKEMDEFSEHKNAFNLWDKTIKRVKEITKKLNNISLTVLTTFNDFNQAKIEELTKYVNDEIEPDDFSFALVRPHKNYHPELDIEKFEKENHKVHYNSRKQGPFIRAYREIIRKKIARYYLNPKYYVPCQSGKLRVVMSPEGDIFPCENLGYPEGNKQNDWYMGNIRHFNHNIHRLLKSSPAKRIRNKIVETKCHCHHGVDMSLSYQSTWKFKLEVLALGLKYAMIKNRNQYASNNLARN
ncbi:MAG: radical SAM protein [Bacteroidota bacterium]|nr:radical SAM protein [Bacteroidota bacterium]